MSHMCRFNILIICANILMGYAQIESPKIKPERCYGTFEVMDRRCCIFPPFFSRIVARECGAIFAVMLIDKEHNVTTFQRAMFDKCKHWRCMLDKYGILDADDTFNNEKYFAHLDKWVKLNPDFSNAVTVAKTFCRDDFRIESPITVCNFLDYQNCIRLNIMLNCPRVVNSQECFEWKEFFEECKEYYV